MAGYQAAYFTAVTLSGIAVTALVAICSAPLMIAALAPWALGERLAPRVRVALALGVVGTALLVAAPRGALDLTARLVAGALLALTAGLAYALYVILAKATLVLLEADPTGVDAFRAGLEFGVERRGDGCFRGAEVGKIASQLRPAVSDERALLKRGVRRDDDDGLRAARFYSPGEVAHRFD